MWLILLSYFLMATTFTLAKTALLYMHPIYFVAFRMIIAGVCLLAFVYFFKRTQWKYQRADLTFLMMIVLFHIYGAYVFEFWGMQFVSSSKACLLYNLGPFITALLSCFLLKQQLSWQKWIALILGFVSMIPILMEQPFTEANVSSGLLSLADLALLAAVVCAAYGWIVMKELVVERQYSPVMVNGIGMFIGGLLALITAVFLEGLQPFKWSQPLENGISELLQSYFSPSALTILVPLSCMALLIIIANFIGYNLYGYLLRFYSPTLLSFFGFITPFIASIFGLIFLSEPLTKAFVVSLAFTVLSLYLFYRQELRGSKTSE